MMEFSSHIIESKNLMDKCLVYDIEVQDIFLSLPGLRIQTNKWLHLEDWLEIDLTIQKLLEPFSHSELLEGFEADVFHLGGAIRVDCKKIRVSRTHKKILGTERQYLPIALHIQIQKVSTKNLMDQIKQFEEKLRRLDKTSSKSMKIDNRDREYDPTSNLDTVSSKSLKLENSDHGREYDPTYHIGPDKNSNDYIPYTASLKTSNGVSTIDVASSRISDNEPYSPKPVCIVESSPDQISESPTEIPKYKPARIGHNKNTKSERDESVDAPKKQEPVKSQAVKSSRRKHSPNVPEKSSNSSSEQIQTELQRATRKIKTTNAELFGSDDSDQEQQNNSTSPTTCPTAESPKRVATPLRTPNTSDKLHDEMKRKRAKLRHEPSRKNPLDGWLTKSAIKKTDKNSVKSVKSSRHREPLEADAQNQDLIELQQIKELSALRDTIKSKRKSPPPEMEILSLTHLTLEEILATFEGVKPILDGIFKVYSKRSKITGFDGINHMRTLMLIDDKKQLQMMNFLRENYQPEEKGVPSLTDLYINALVPEWTVNVFMKEFNFTRTEAIDRLQAQEESSAHHNSEAFDSSGNF